jgi:hypothetical protein
MHMLRNKPMNFDRSNTRSCLKIWPVKFNLCLNGEAFYCFFRRKLLFLKLCKAERNDSSHELQ